MNFEKYNVQACCGTHAIIYKTSVSLSKDTLDALIKNGFNEHSHFTKAGILYVDNLEFIVRQSLCLK